jgi:hypothetical protein
MNQKRLLLLLFIPLIALSVVGNTRFIRLDSIAESERHLDKYLYIQDNEQYIDHWQPEWHYSVGKESLIKGLKGCLDVYSKYSTPNVEISLLLGDICHYLYNLNETDYYDQAIANYKKAIKMAPNDYRPLWFLAKHYALSNAPDQSVESLFLSQKLLPSVEPCEFWEDYCIATSLANMPSHCLFGMDQVKKILGRAGSFELQLGDVTRSRIESVRSDSTYSFEDIWTFSEDSLITFLCRPLGVKLSLHPDWGINLYDYQKQQCFVTIVPPAITGNNGDSITYSVLLISKVAQAGERLSDFMRQLTSSHPEKTSSKFQTKYPGQLSYEYTDKEIYKDMGGAHMLFVGFERTEPDYAGLLLEEPSIPKLPDETDGVHYLRPGNFKGRFKGRIFYAVLLDTCEDIYEGSLKMFDQIVNKQIVVE